MISVSGSSGAAVPKWILNKDGEVLAPVVRAEEDPPLPTATSGAVAAGYTAFGADGLVEGSGKIVKWLEYGRATTRFDAGNGRYYFELPINISKISTISAVANGTSGTKSGLTITVKKADNPLGYTITTLCVDDMMPIQTEHVITNGKLRLEAFGDVNTKVDYSILEEN